MDAVVSGHGGSTKGDGVKGRFNALVCFPPLLLVLVTGLAAAPPKINVRDASLLNAFAILCTREPPVFDHIRTRASAMKMRLFQEEIGPSAADTKTRRSAWVGALKTGPFFVFADETSGAKGIATGCAVGGPVADPVAFRSQAIKTLALDGSPQPERGTEGALSFTWSNARGPGATIIVRDDPNAGTPSIRIKLLYMSPAR